MKPRLVIVGAGLGGCVLADALTESWEITIIEMVSHGDLFLQSRVRDVDIPAITYPHIGTGLGGTTQFWHNGILEPDEQTFIDHWPYPKAALDPYFSRAFKKIAWVSRASIVMEGEKLRSKYSAAGLPTELLGQDLFYPSRRFHAWNDLNLQGRVKVVDGEAVRIVTDGIRHISAVMVKTGDQGESSITGDVFVLAAGGLGTPLLLQRLAETNSTLPALDHAGRHYEDHPSVVVGEVILNQPLYKLWNYPTTCIKGSLRSPLCISQDGLRISFQLRPAAHFWIINPRNRVKTVLHELRNQPLNPLPYLKLLSHWDDVLEILSFKFGVHWPTRHYSLVMIAEQPPSEERAISTNGGDSTISRRWSLREEYLDSLRKAIDTLLKTLEGKFVSSTIFPDWPKHMTSSSHHSGTARMASSSDDGVCDPDGRVFGCQNLFVCDGSLIPASGYANTGLTIAALAIRLADLLTRTENQPIE